MVKIMRQIVPKEPHAVLHYQNREEKVVPSTSDILLTGLSNKALNCIITGGPSVLHCDKKQVKVDDRE